MIAPALGPYALALGITLAIEVPVVATVFREQWARMAAVCAAATLATHLVMHFLLPVLFEDRGAWLLVGEAQAVVLEALAYAGLSRPRDLARALVASALANTLSFLAGWLV